MLSARVLLRFLPVRFSSPQRHAQLRTRGIQRPAGPVRAPKGAAPARPIGRPGRPPPVGACVRLLGQCMKLCMTLCPPPPPPSRTDWTRLVPPSVLTGHVPRCAAPAAAPAGLRRARASLRAQVEAEEGLSPHEVVIASHFGAPAGPPPDPPAFIRNASSS